MDETSMPPGTRSLVQDSKGDPSTKIQSFATHDEGYKDLSSPNRPHPSLEFPPVYFLLHLFPSIEPVLDFFYRFRWSITYPLQRQIPFNRQLRKLGLYLTWGELFLMIPFFFSIILGTFYSFINPNVVISGHTSRTPLIFAFVTAMRNSFLTLLLGIPVERAIWYHKLSARIAWVNSILHTYAAFAHPDHSSNNNKRSNFFNFLFDDSINTGGTMLVFVMTGMMVISLPWVRRNMFEMFYYLHVVFAALMVCFAFYHTGYTLVILASLSWGFDLIIRKLCMAFFLYPRKATLRILSDSVVEVTIPKTAWFNYNPGQHIHLCVPELGLFQWHPFSLSSCPEQKVATLHIRKSGGWTSALYELAQKKEDINIMFEGPYGSVGVDIMSDRYKMIMLVSGGIGVTPMQSICNELMLMYSTKRRELKKLSFIWTERDPVMTTEVDVVRHSSSIHHMSSKHLASLEIGDDSSAAVSKMHSYLHAGNAESIVSTLLSMVPQSGISDEQLEEYYSCDDEANDEDHGIGTIYDEQSDEYRSCIEDVHTTGTIHGPLGKHDNTTPPKPKRTIDILDTCGSDSSAELNLREKKELSLRECKMKRRGKEVDVSHVMIDVVDDLSYEETVVREAYHNKNLHHSHLALDLHVYLTAKKEIPAALAELPFVHLHRPDFRKIFWKMREEAFAKGETHVAVCVCGPTALVKLCRYSCAKYSDSRVQFDFHYEVYD
jgi:predicted ferric reductase